MDLPWQAGAKAQLQRDMDAGRLPHALLISAYPGWGEVELSQWLALKLLSQAPDADPRALAHPDLRWIAPDGERIKVEQIRALAEYAQGKPQAAPAKVAVLECADAMNIHAANALLKTLEEPPGATHLVLASHRAGALPPTVRSRCRQVRIPRDRAAALAWLQARREDAAGEGDGAALLQDYDGAPLLAASGARQGERPMRDILAELARGSAAALIDELQAQDPRRLSQRWARWLTVAMRQDAAPSRRLFAFVDELLWFHRQITESSSANRQLLLERLCWRWQRLAVREMRKSKPISH